MGKIINIGAAIGAALGARHLLEANQDTKAKLEKAVANAVKGKDLNKVSNIIKDVDKVYSHIKDVNLSKPASLVDAANKGFKSSLNAVKKIDQKHNGSKPEIKEDKSGLALPDSIYRYLYDKCIKENRFYFGFGIGEYDLVNTPYMNSIVAQTLFDHSKLYKKKGCDNGFASRSLILAEDKYSYQSYDVKEGFELLLVRHETYLIDENNKGSAKRRYEIFIIMDNDKYKLISSEYQKMFNDRELAEKINYKFSGDDEVAYSTVYRFYWQKESCPDYAKKIVENAFKDPLDVEVQLCLQRLMNEVCNISNDDIPWRDKDPKNVRRLFGTTYTRQDPEFVRGTIVEDSPFRFPEDMTTDIYDKLISRLSLYRNIGKPQKILFQGSPGRGKTMKVMYLCKQLNIQPIEISYDKIEDGILEMVGGIPPAHDIRFGIYGDAFHKKGDKLACGIWTREQLDNMIDFTQEKVPHYALIVNDIDRVLDDDNTVSELLHFLEEHKNCWVFFTSNNISKIPEAMRRPGRLDMIFLEEEIEISYAESIVDNSFKNMNFNPTEELRSWVIDCFIQGGFASLKQALLRVEVEGELAMPMPNEITFNQPKSLDTNEVYQEFK